VNEEHRSFDGPELERSKELQVLGRDPLARGLPAGLERHPVARHRRLAAVHQEDVAVAAFLTEVGEKHVLVISL
jgi:hypothetical protein